MTAIELRAALTANPARLEKLRACVEAGQPAWVCGVIATEEVVREVLAMCNTNAAVRLTEKKKRAKLRGMGR